MAVRSDNAITSSGRSSARPLWFQLSLAPVDRLEEWLPSSEDWYELPVFVPPDFTTMVASPRRVEMYSAVGRSFVPKKTWVVLLKSVPSRPSGQQSFSCAID